MSFSSMLLAHDDAALEALVSKGVMRRARRDFESGLATISVRGDADASVLADGQTVEIDARGPSAARCTCPAGRLCRHVLLAVMALRADGAAPETDAASHTATDAEASTGSVIAEICAITQADLMKFAGADWDAAVTLSATSDGVSITPCGRNCRVELAASPVSVTFIAGQGLKNAVYKGPKTRARTVIAACAILLRAKHGIAVETGEDDAARADAPLAAEFLGDSHDTLARATRIVLAGSSPIAVDLLFDLAISARAQAAPRLTAQLRRLARLAGLAITRDVGFEADRFLAEAARTFALIEALKGDAANPALTGSLRRDYRAHPALDLWILGASRWRSETGARGLTLYGFSPESKQWHSASFARAAGQDPSFDPKTAYRLPLWSAGPAENLMGSAVHLPEPLVAAERSIALTLPKPAKVTSRLKSASQLADAGACHTIWAHLRRDLRQRIGIGLHRSSQPVPALLAPAKFGGFAFDEFAQTYEWEAIDAVGDRLVLTIPAGSDDLALRLRRENRHICLVTVEITSGDERLVIRPIAICSEKSDALEVLNLDLDHWQRAGILRTVVNAAQEALSIPKALSAPTHDPLRDIANRAIDAAASVAAGEKVADVQSLKGACEAAGLITLADAVERMTDRPDIVHALGTAYVANEVRAALVWF